MSTSPTDETRWRFCFPIEVRFEDIDMFHHVNNAKYLTYIESARVAYCVDIFGVRDPREFNMTVASAKVDFIKPIFFGQAVDVFTRTSRVGTKSWTLEHELRDHNSGELMATAYTVNVHYDYATGQSRPLPADMVERLEQFEGHRLRGG